MYLLNGKKIDPAESFTVGSGDSAIQYPANWVACATASEKVAIGLTEVSDPVWPDKQFYDVTENPDGTIISAAKLLGPIKDDFKEKIDQVCGAKRAAVVSPGEYIAEEYRLAYDDAMAYKAAGYSGSVPSSVRSWATASGMAATAAADDIIATRAAYMTLLDAIRAIRLTGKAAVDAAATPEAILAAVNAVHTGLAAL